MKTKFQNLILLFAFLIIVSCSPVTGINSVNSEDENLSNQPQALPPTVSIPIGSLEGGDDTLPSLSTTNTVAYAQDGEGNFPVGGGAGTVTDFATTDQVALSTEPLSADLASSSVIPAKAGIQSQLYKLSSISLFNEAHANTNICANENVTCCPINSNGGWDVCYLNTGSVSPANIYYTVVDENGNAYDDSVEDTIQGNLLYAGNTPQDIVSLTDGTSYVVTNDMAIKLDQNSDGHTQVQGDYNNHYENFVSEGSKVSYDSTNALMGVMNVNDGVNLFTVSSGVVRDTGITASVSDALSYTVVKGVNDMLLYATEHEAKTEAYVEVANSSMSSYSSYHSSSSSISRIQYLSCTDPSSASKCDLDDAGNPIYSTKVLAVDSITYDLNVYTVVAFVDDQDNVRIKFAKKDGLTSVERFGDTFATTFIPSAIKEISIYHTQSSSSDNSKLAILDNENNRVVFGEFNASTQTVNIDTANSVSVGSNPVAMKLYNNRLYVLNNTDQSVSVMRLFEDDGATPLSTPEVVATALLNDQLSGKTLSFNPNSLDVKNGKVIVSDATNKSLVLINTDQITESEITSSGTSGSGTSTGSGSSTGTGRGGRGTLTPSTTFTPVFPTSGSSSSSSSGSGSRGGR